MNYPTQLTVNVSRGSTRTLLHLSGSLISEPKVGCRLRVNLGDGAYTALLIDVVYEDLSLGCMIVHTTDHPLTPEPQHTTDRLARAIEQSLAQQGWVAKVEPPVRKERIPNINDPKVQQQMSGDKH